MNVGLKIKELRQNKKMSQEELAICLGVSTQAVSRWETSVTFPDITMIPKIAEIFNCSTDYILCKEDNTIKKEIEDVIKKADDILDESGYEDYLTPLKIVRECLIKYPNNEKLMIEVIHRITAYANEIEGFDYSEAIILCEKILDQSKNDLYREEAKICLIDCYVKSGLKDKALDVMKSIAITLNPYEVKMRIYEKDSLEYKEASLKNKRHYTMQLIRCIFDELSNNINKLDSNLLIDGYLSVEKVIKSIYGDKYIEDKGFVYYIIHTYIMVTKKYLLNNDINNAFIYFEKLVNEAVNYKDKYNDNSYTDNVRKWVNSYKGLDKIKELDKYKELASKL